MERVLSIQYLRGIAALLVVVFHTGVLVSAAGFRFPIGAAGVNVFFVISGFVMWITTANTRPWPFMRRRLVRIVPIYWLLTLVLAFVSTDGGLSLGLDATPGQLAGSLLFIAYQSQIDPVRVEPILQPGWTLNLEMLFYVIMAMALWFPRRLQPAAIAVPLLAMVAVGMSSGVQNPVAEFYCSPLLIEFLIGIGFGILWMRGYQQALTTGWCMAAAGMTFGLSVASLSMDAPRFGLSHGLAPGLIVLAALMAERSLRKWPIAPLRLLGDASYSLYLSHVIVLSLLAVISRHFSLPSIFVAVAAVLCCVLVAVPIYLGIERPMGRALSRWLTRPKRGLAGTM